MSDAAKEKPTDTSDTILKITAHAQDQISWVRSAYGWIATLIAGLIIVGLWFTYKDVRDFKAEIREQGEKIQKAQEAEQQLLSQKLRSDLQAEADRVRNEIVKRVDDEFETQQISKLVHDETKQRIDAIANVLIQNTISNQLAPVSLEFGRQLTKSREDIRAQLDGLTIEAKQARKTEGELQTTLVEARDLLTKLDRQSELVLTILAAQTDDRSAFEKLEKWSLDQKYPLKKEAGQATLATRLNWHGQLGEQKAFISAVPWADGVKPNTLSFEETQIAWSQTPLESFARPFLDFVWGNTNFSKDQRLSFLHDVLKDSHNSLSAADRAARLLAGELNATYNPPFIFDDINLKWDERQKTNKISGNSTNGLAAPKPK